MTEDPMSNDSLPDEYQPKTARSATKLLIPAHDKVQYVAAWSHPSRNSHTPFSQPFDTPEQALETVPPVELLTLDCYILRCDPAAVGSYTRMYKWVNSKECWKRV